ncbi:hypothetical protein [Leucobacter soli]
MSSATRPSAIAVIARPRPVEAPPCAVYGFGGGTGIHCGSGCGSAD